MEARDLLFAQRNIELNYCPFDAWILSTTVRRPAVCFVTCYKEITHFFSHNTT